MSSLFIRENEATFAGTVSGNSTDTVPLHSPSEAAFQIIVGVSVAVIGGTGLEFVHRFISEKEMKPPQVHITQDQFRKAQELIEEASSETEKPQ